MITATHTTIEVEALPGSPALGRSARASRPRKTENRCSLGALWVKFPPIGPARRPGTSGRAPERGDKRCQKVTKSAIPSSGHSASRSALVFFCPTVREGRFRTSFCQRDGSAKISISVIGNHEKSSLVISAGLEGVGKPGRN